MTSIGDNKYMYGSVTRQQKSWSLADHNTKIFKTNY